MSERPYNLAADQASLWVNSSFFADLIRIEEYEEMIQFLCEQLRELTGALTTTFFEYMNEEHDCRPLYVCPPRRKNLFENSLFSTLCPACSGNQLPVKLSELADTHPLKQPLMEAGFNSLVQFPVYVGDTLCGSFFLFNLPQLDKLDRVQGMLDFLAPTIGLVIRNCTAQQEIRQQKIQLEEMVAARTQELDEARRAAFNLLEDAVLAKRELEITQTAVDNLSDANIWVYETGQIFKVNKAACASLGYTEQELQGLYVKDIDPDLRDKNWSSVLLAFREEKDATMERRLRRKDGTVYPVELKVMHLEFEGQLIVCAFARDITERKRIEKEIVNLARFPEENPNPVMRASTAGKILYANPACCHLKAFKPVMGKDLPRDWKVHIHNACSMGHPIEYSLSVGERIFLTTFTPIPEQHYVNLYARDITEKEQSKIALEESEARYRILFENLSTGFALHEMIFDEQGNPADYCYLQVNPAFEKATGLSAAKVVGKCISAVLPDLEEGWIQEFGHVVQSGRPAHFENYVSALDRYYDVRAFPAGENRFGVLFSDISDQKEHENQLLRLSTAIEQSPESIIITDNKGRIAYVNSAFEQITGYTSDMVMGLSPGILRSGKQEKELYEELWKTIQSGEVWEGRLVNRRRDGTLYTEEARISPVKDSTGTITNYVAVQRDISDQIVQEEKYRQSQKMEAVGQLAGGIAHDFNNILQGIFGFSEMLMGRFDQETLEYEDAKEINASAKRAAELTQQLLTFSRKQPTTLAVINVNESIRTSRALLDVLLGEKVEIILNLSDDLHPVITDANQVTQLIMNLAVNARDAMGGAGRLTISSENALFLEADVKANPQAQAGVFSCISVTDTGCGIEQDVIDRLFEPFFTTKEVGKGTGLGLSVVYGIVEQSKGWIDVYSELGQGSTFRIYLPAEIDEGHVEHEKYLHFSEDTGQRILLVEDDELLAPMVKEILQSVNYIVDISHSAEEALELFKTMKPSTFDLLLSDMNLPGKDGSELADEIRKLQPNIPVLLYSGYQDQEKRWSHLQNRDYHFINKPHTMSRLLNTVRDLLRTKS